MRWKAFSKYCCYCYWLHTSDVGYTFSPWMYWFAEPGNCRAWIIEMLHQIQYVVKQGCTRQLDVLKCILLAIFTIIVRKCWLWSSWDKLVASSTDCQACTRNFESQKLYIYYDGLIEQVVRLHWIKVLNCPNPTDIQIVWSTRQGDYGHSMWVD